MLDAGTRPPYFRCNAPGEFAQVCDEASARTAELTGRTIALMRA
jgi:hypothetical protein